MRRHPEIGARILEHAGLHQVAAWVRAHHERMDGHGYPDRLAAGEIALESRILAVADAYEAMIADRPYRAGMPPEAARRELERCADSQFDPAVIRAFVSTLDAAPGGPADIGDASGRDGTDAIDDGDRPEAGAPHPALQASGGAVLGSAV
jgi:HD-GYP domain-containing protein (c-di-GMP phosphodiesterase class II)